MKIGDTVVAQCVHKEVGEVKGVIVEFSPKLHWWERKEVVVEVGVRRYTCYRSSVRVY